MIINQIKFSPYRIAFKKTFETAITKYSFREGIIIRIQSGQFSGFGETAPLSPLSKETITESRNALEGFALAINNVKENQTLEDLLLLAHVHTFNNPSALFGLESAIYDLYSKIKKIPFWKNFSNYCDEFISINGLEKDINRKIKYLVYKIKLTNKNIFIVKEKLSELQKKVKKNVKFRLDINGTLDLARAIRLCKELEKYNIEYIEQPLPINELEDLAELRLHTNIPIALDESIIDIKSAEKIIETQSADIFVIKPMIIGSIKECLEIIKLGKENNIESVITTSLGTEIERKACIHIAFAGGIKLPCGFSTNSLLKSDVIYKPIEKIIINKPTHFGLNILPETIPFQ